MKTSFMYLVLLILIVCMAMCAPKKETVKIGLSVTLTGTSSTFGVNLRNGALLAVEQTNSEGGINRRPVELIIRDDKSDPDEAVRVDLELIDAGVVAIIGHYLSSIAVKTVPVMNDNKMLMIGSTVSTAELTGLDDFFIRLIGSVDQQSRVVVNLINDRLKLKNIAVVYDVSNRNYTETYFRFFRQEFEKAGGKISIAVPFDSRKPYSASELADTVINAGSEGVFLLTNAIHGALVCQHLKKKVSELPVVGCQWNFSDPNFIQNGGKAVEGVISVNAYNSESTEKRYLKYKKEYENRFGGKVSMADMMGYDAAMMLIEALGESDKPEDLKRVVLSRTVFKGVGGDIHLDSFGDAHRDMYILEIKNGAIRTTGKIPVVSVSDQL